MSVYRREQPAFLHECLQSLHVQTQPAHEIVVVLDGEITQDLQAALDEWRTRLPLKIVPLPQNVGLGKALNAGIEHCTHDYIFRMDSDDIAHPERFALQCAFLQQHPETDLLGGQIAEFDRHIPADSTRMNMRRVPLTHADIVRFSKKRNPFNHMTVAYRKSSLHRVGGYQHHLWMEDYNLWLRMLAAGMQCANLPQILVYARKAGNTSAANGSSTASNAAWRCKHHWPPSAVSPNAPCPACSRPHSCNFSTTACAETHETHTIARTAPD